ncbi:hypothetical protein Acid345_3024 [Candidatus Koribacter versatilis Ellin345]|uniref:Uncharacterized protein n=1 Tax=Koribacter versatilis (strain Ellin345) TaxID=204669 RepID=Q1IM75_KORVE|nr:hypothetical protein [Candidatus Koribacter versatilis]ABF42025.1 hypothetical protein Acid345_3024 [Candidatus Koribacter versatilis Ellin345]
MRNAQIEIADIAGQMDALRQALEMQMDELRARQTELAEQLKAVQRSITAKAEPVPPPPVNVNASKPTATAEPAPPKPAAIPEEIMLVIAAAVAAFVGKSARIRSARYMHEGQSPWAQQGRVFIQASHNLRNS